MRTTMRHGRLVALLAAAILLPSLAGCGGGGGGAAAGGCGSGATAPSTPFGAAATSVEGVTYQPDVVVITCGQRWIRDVSPDGMTWTLDARAPEAGDLRPGAVVVVTGGAAGRIQQLRRDNDAVVVTLAPVQLTDIIRDGHIAVDQDIDIAHVTVAPEPITASTITDPGAISPNQPEGAAATATAAPAGAAAPSAATPLAITLPEIRLVAATRDDINPAWVPKPQGSLKVSINGWDVEPYVKPKTLGVKVQYEAAQKLKVGADLSFKTNNLHVEYDASILDGASDRSPTFLLSGLTGLSLALAAGAQQLADNRRVRIEIPAEFDIPLPPSPATAGIPLIQHFKFKVIVETAFSGGDATIKADGGWNLDGPIGMRAGKLLAPAFSVVHSVVDSLRGIALAPTGIVIAEEFRYLVGVGVHELAAAGSYVKVVAAVGFGSGSVLGAPLVRCRGATLDIRAGTGLGFHVSAAIEKQLAALLPKGAKLEGAVEVLWTVVHRQVTTPSVPLCQI